MGEKRLKEWLTYDQLIERYGWSKSFFYKRANELRPALVKINGKARKPHKFDTEIVDQNRMGCREYCL